MTDRTEPLDWMTRADLLQRVADQERLIGELHQRAKDYAATVENLTAVQARCRELLLANRRLRGVPDEEDWAITDAVLSDVTVERRRQNEKWKRKPGVWEATDDRKLTVLTEEVGEVAKALCDREADRALYDELVQVAAVAVSFAETVAHRAWGPTSPAEPCTCEKRDRCARDGCTKCCYCGAPVPEVVP